MRPKIIYTHERRIWPLLELLDCQQWNFALEEEFKECVVVLGSRMDITPFHEALGTLNLLSFSGAPPGCVMLKGWELYEHSSGIVRIVVEFHRRRMPFYMRVLPH